MPLFKRCDCPEDCDRSSCACRCHGFIRRHKLVRRTAALGGILVGVYFLGASQGWWDRFLF
jgi:hypothetical protein